MCGILGMSIYCIQDLKSMKAKIDNNIIDMTEINNNNYELIDKIVELYTKYNDDETLIVMDPVYSDICDKLESNGINLNNKTLENNELIEKFNKKVERFPYNIYVLFLN